MARWFVFLAEASYNQPDTKRNQSRAGIASLMFQNPIFALSIIAIIASASHRATLADETLDLRAVRSLETDPHLTRDGNRLTIRLENRAYRSVYIPRMHASLRSISWVGIGSSKKPTVRPETDHWVIRWKKAPKEAKAIELLFDTPPELKGQLDPIGQLGDGRLNLHAYQATTTGEKLRFEPQPHKNTIGYWVNAKDFATWTIRVDRPGEFNVGILQGCGSGQGGSVAALSLGDGDQIVDRIEFTVEETGHFQNFIWRTVGVIRIPKAGDYTVRLQPKKIKHAALMDVRQIQLIPLP